MSWFCLQCGEESFLFLLQTTVIRKIVISFIFLGGVLLGNALISADTCIGKE
jgi:hypothetical protein